VLTWNVGSVRVMEDMKGNIFPRKDKNDATVKIDGLIAILMAVARRLALDSAGDSQPTITVLGGASDAREGEVVRSNA
jgi:phage terminase large subunit-like protein